MKAIRAPEGSRRWSRRWTYLLGTATLAAPIALVGALVGASPPPAPTPAQRAEAIGAPSVVYVGITWKGYVLRPSPLQVDGTLTTSGWMGPYTVTTACSGFVADSTGYVVTAGHCVDNTSMTEGGKAAIIDADVAHLHSAFPEITSVELARVKSAIVANGRVEGTTSGAPPARTVTVYPTGVGNVTGSTAETVDFKSLDQGDVALLKVPLTSLPAVTVAPTDPPTGTSVVLAGYAGTVAALADKPEPSFKEGETSSQQTINGVPFTEVSAAATGGMSGGPALDVQGRVIGTVSFKPGAEASSSFNFITATSTIRSLLQRNGVSTTLTAADQAYRTGLTYLFAGRYHKAAKAFDQVLAVEPQHVKALAYKQQAIANYANDVDTGSSNTMLIVGIAIGAVLVLGIAAVLLLRRRRPAGPPIPAEPTVVGPAPTIAAPSVEAGPPEPVPTTPVVVPATPVEAPVVEAPTVVEPPPAPVTVEVKAQVFCPNCGAAHDTDAHFCTECGEHFKQPVAAGRGRLNGHRK